MSRPLQSDPDLHPAIRDAWDPEQVRRSSRILADLAAAELTDPGFGPVRVPDFLRRARRLLSARYAAPGMRAQGLAVASLHTSHPCFMAQQICAPVPLAALAESLVSALNQSIAVWDMSPAATLVDREVMAWFKRKLGFPVTADGTLVPGGSFANLTALLAARAALQPRAWQNGGGKLAILAGAHTHYSISRAAGIMGLGARSVFSIPTDALHRTDPAAVAGVARAARAAGYRKFVLVGTCGSTPTGACDDLLALAAAARALGAWFHVDAAHGGGFAFAPKLRPKLRGLEAADSVAFDPHKMMFMPLAAGAVLMRRGADLHNAFEHDAPYLFSPVTRAQPDIGHATIACSQRFDAAKIWLVWKAYGESLFGAMVQSVCNATLAAHAYCLASSRLEPVHQPESNIFCFRLRGLPPGPRADAAHWKLKEAVNASGKAYISSTVLGRRRVLRLVVMNPRSTPSHALRVLQVTEALASPAGARR